ncbi:pyruvate ferredoxin oxidoreductase [Archaeoglobus profundus]|uniref:Pyruvate flavodoxin/ferredoxin oxidoreductase domain protein n=1 Tax=Archaeoglobus profundus (strain DSM 5631 / JCM 9629 / NBRC 100127 / Av18) TaxID=572546 RepID=D2RHQ1_ARCPA|nr:pyruvate ferredoxin oxidoreductase [Archaeoglobus profundus]ADB57826.1 pyruvate flavodoxin/ferredoxin oxidoreductase domain protein [Archaeoglobus profundus DSM 5631]
MRTILTGNYAVAEAVKLSRVKVIAAYPITPQTTIVERLAEMVERGEIDAEFVRVESEHSALAVVYGSSSAGLRSFTATSSHGLLYMYEMCWWVSNARIPLVMAVVTRTIGPPWNIHTEHTDILTLRDSGWIVAMAENAQEALDLTIQGFKVSESVNLPFAVGLDGFVISHTAEVVDVPDQSSVDSFLPDRKQAYVITPDEPIAIGNIAQDEVAMRLRYDMARDMERSKEVIERVGREFGEKFGRKYGLVEHYMTEDADYVVIMSGAWCGDAKEAVDILRSKGIPIGLLKLTYVRPFPIEELQKIEDREVLVIDRSFSMGHKGILGLEVGNVLDCKNVIAGLCGVDMGVEDFVEIFNRFVRGEIKEVEWWLK